MDEAWFTDETARAAVCVPSEMASAITATAAEDKTAEDKTAEDKTKDLRRMSRSP
jgi:hypothetical protein